MTAKGPGYERGLPKPRNLTKADRRTIAGLQQQKLWQPWEFQEYKDRTRYGKVPK